MLHLALYAALALGVSSQRVCNNSPDLCDRKYNNITHLGAHDSPFLRNGTNNFNAFGDQHFNSTVQLDAGVRLLTGQVHQNNTSWDLCHTACFFLDAGPLTNWLRDLKSWLDNNPNDVITILLVNSDNANATTLDQQFQAADIVDYAYAPSDVTRATSDWPTLGEMIDQNKRLVTWIANLPPANNQVAPYLLDQFTFVFENNYDVSDPANFACEPDRPSTVRNEQVQDVLADGYLPLMNHFLYNSINGIESPAEDRTNNTNAASGSTGNLGDAATNCTTFYGRPPTYILVDFFSVGRPLETIDRLNGVVGKTSGRLELPDTVEDSRNLSNQTIYRPASTTVSSSSAPGGTSSSHSTSQTSTTSTQTNPAFTNAPRLLQYFAPALGALVVF